MGLETGNYIDNLDRDWPLSSDNVSEGDNHLQLIKRALQYTFPLGTDTSATSDVGPDQAVQVLIAKSSEPTIDTSASGHAARAMGMLWLDTSAGAGNAVLKMRNQANDDWVEFAVSAETSKSVDVNAGTIDGAVIGGSSPAAGDFTTLATTGALTVGTDITISGDDIIMATNTDAYILVADGSSYNPVAISGDATITNAGVVTIGADKVTAPKISFIDDSLAVTDTHIMIADGTDYNNKALSGDVTMTNAGVVTVAKITGETIDTDAAANDQVLKYSTVTSKWEKVNSEYDDKLNGIGQLITYNGTSDTRWAGGTTTTGDLNSSYDGKVLTADSTLTYGMDWKDTAVADGAITNAKMADMAANTVKVRNADSSGVPSDLALATTEIMIGDGTGFTAAALSGDVTMANTGAVTIANDAVEQAMIADDAVGADQLASDAVVNASIASSAGIDATKIADGTVTSTEFQYINSLSSNAQTQLDAKLALSGGTMSGETVFADQLATRPKIKDYSETVNAIGSTGGGTQDFDLTLGNTATATVDTSTNTFTFSNPPATGTAGTLTLILTNGGSQTVNWPGAVDWPGGTAPTLTTSGIDILTFLTIDAGTIWYGFASGLDMGTP